jgi:hypothetical protein
MKRLTYNFCRYTLELFYKRLRLLEIKNKSRLGLYYDFATK